MKKLLSVLLITVLCLALTTPGTVSAAVKISKSKATMELDSTLKLTINTDSKILWTTNKKKVATISTAGMVTAKTVGEATITATSGNKEYTCLVNVVNSNKTSFDDILGPGEYLVGTDIPSGKYNLTCISGAGVVYIYSSSKDYENEELWVKTVNLASGDILESLKSMYSLTFKNLTIKNNQYIIIPSGLEARFQK